jgi:aryl-alcohol dehydrogenase-like predicted oxidoreductase
MTPIEEILRGYDDLIRSGKVRYGGLSNFPAWRVAYGVARASERQLAPLGAISYEYGLAERSAERDVLPMAEALGLGVGCWSPLGGGFLARDDKPDGAPPESHLAHWRGLGRPTPTDERIRNVLRARARAAGVSPARLAVGWLLARARRSVTGVVPVIGSSSAEQIEDLVAATTLEFDADTLAALEEVSRIHLGEPHDHNNFHADLTDGGAHYPPPFTVA